MKTLKFILIGAVPFLTAVGQATQAAEQEYIFTAPPRGAPAAEAKTYEPIAKYLSQVTGKKIVYQHPDNWLTYQNEMQKGTYDLVFDGPHFISWRMVKTQHQPLAKLPGKLAFVVATSAKNDKFTDLSQLAGRTVCGLAPPNLATLTIQAQFDNPVRQPLIVEVPSFKAGYKEMLGGKKCIAAVMRDKMFNKLNGEKKAGRVIWASKGVANQGFSASPRFSAEDKRKMQQALVAPDAQQAMSAFLDRFSKGNKQMQIATDDDYNGLAVLLKDVWGFDLRSVATVR